jgi:hypothetical protein
MNATSPAWFGSDTRKLHCDDIAAVASWKRFFICLKSYRAWSLATVLDKAALHFLKVEDDFESFDRTLRLADTQWAKVYNIPNRSRLLTRDEDFDSQRGSTY